MTDPSGIGQPCSCPLCAPERWVKGQWVRDPEPRGEGFHADLYPVHYEDGQSYYVRRADA
jgi:hypothetical protein